LWLLALAVSPEQRPRLLGRSALSSSPKGWGPRQNAPARRRATGQARAGDLTAVSVPTGEDDALRDLSRARADTLNDLKDATFRLKAFLLCHASRSTGRAHWGPAHLRWLSAVVGPTPAQPMVLQA